MRNRKRSDILVGVVLTNPGHFMALQRLLGRPLLFLPPMETVRLGKTLLLAILLVWNSLTAIGFAVPFPNLKIPGLVCLIFGIFWLYFDHRNRILTQDEQTEKLLLKAATRYKQTGSWNTVIAEFRASGFSEYTLFRLQNAPQILSQRAKLKIQKGLALMALGLFLIISHYLMVRLDHLRYEAFVALGAGLGLMLQGFWLKRIVV